VITNTDAAGSAVSRDVTNTYTIASVIQNDVVNTLAIVSGSHCNALKNPEDARSQNRVVSTLRTLPVRRVIIHPCLDARQVSDLGQK